ncbi:hypothetical protein [Duncaniella muris]|uniref:hypothetical protein n=1 Tax=Duncaniella muris TaxID=2094150 RepID=UPI0025B33610|nr:hypothetical protein [Duncaniella muris]
MATDSWIRLSYARRLFVWLLGYSLLLVGSMVIFQYGREKEFKAAELNSQLQLVNLHISDGLAEGKTVEQIDLDRFAPLGDIRVSIIDSQGKVIYDNSLDHLPAQTTAAARKSPKPCATALDTHCAATAKAPARPTSTRPHAAPTE